MTHGLCGVRECLDRQVVVSPRGRPVLEFLLQYTSGVDALARLVELEFLLGYLGFRRTR